MGLFSNIFKSEKEQTILQEQEQNWEINSGDIIKLDFDIPVTNIHPEFNIPLDFMITIKLKDEYKNLGEVANHITILYGNEVKIQKITGGYYIYGFEDIVKTIDVFREIDYIPIFFDIKSNINALNIQSIKDKFEYKFELKYSPELTHIFRSIKNLYSFDITKKYEWESILVEQIESYVSSTEGLITGLDTKTQWKKILVLKNKIIFLQKNIDNIKAFESRFITLKNDFFSELRKYISLIILKSNFSQISNLFWIKNSYGTKTKISEKQKFIKGEFIAYDLELQKIIDSIEVASIKNEEPKIIKNNNLPIEQGKNEKIEGIGYISEKFTPQIFNYMSNTPTNDYTGIYVIHNITQQKYYVGQAKKVMNRLYNHFSGKGGNEGSHNLYYDYQIGEKFEVWTVRLNDSEFDSLDKLERKTIEFYQAYEFGYNGNRGNRN